MSDTSQTAATTRPSLYLPAGADRFDEQRGLGFSSINIKLSPQDSHGILIVENTFRAKGGPPRHMHYDEDEWFYIAEGEFVFEVGTERYMLKTGDSLLGPRQVPHVWAHTGDGVGRVVIAFNPAGKMEAFFREVTSTNAMPAQDKALWHSYGLDLLGPPMLAR